MKRSSKKGFTLAELLIVVAIIAILIAIMFPVFGAQLSKARLAADTANVRSAYSEAVADAMLDDTFAPTAPSSEPAAGTPAVYTVNITLDLANVIKYGSTASVDNSTHIVTVKLGTDSMTFEIDPDVNLTISNASGATT